MIVHEPILHASDSARFSRAGHAAEAWAKLESKSPAMEADLLARCEDAQDSDFYRYLFPVLRIVGALIQLRSVS